jgi:hypothetical protein
MRGAAGLQRRGLHVPLRWRAAHGLWFSMQSGRRHRRAAQPSKRSGQEFQYRACLGLLPQAFGYVLSIRRAHKTVFASAAPVAAGIPCSAKPSWSCRKHRLCAGAQSRIQEAVQAPAAAQHVPVACVCLQAASPNAQCGLAVVLRPLPNPSIERTSPGKPGAASHLKR